MVFNSFLLLVAVLAVIIVWISVLTVIGYRLLQHYNRLIGGNQKVGLREILDTILDHQVGFNKKIHIIEEEIQDIQRTGKLHIQKVGIVRFNPFSDTGGLQSFTIALLDGNQNGIVMTSLYARSGNRWYLKDVRHAHGKDLVLSKEEEMAIKKASPIDT